MDHRTTALKGGLTLGEPAVAWFCVRSQPKQEHLAAVHLAQLPSVEVFCPRIRFTRPTRRGPAVFTEALFPGYLFARFEWRTGLVPVRHTRGVRGVVRFGLQWPVLDPAMIEDLRSLLGPDSIRDLPSMFSPGEIVRINGGAFHGLEAVVSRVMPSRQRISVLLEMLGRSAMVELDLTDVAREAPAEDPMRIRIFYPGPDVAPA